jgi:hypothetical protein
MNRRKELAQEETQWLGRIANGEALQLKITWLNELDFCEHSLVAKSFLPNYDTPTNFKGLLEHAKISGTLDQPDGAKEWDGSMRPVEDAIRYAHNHPDHVANIRDVNIQTRLLVGTIDNLVFRGTRIFTIDVKNRPRISDAYSGDIIQVMAYASAIRYNFPQYLQGDIFGRLCDKSEEVYYSQVLTLNAINDVYKSIKRVYQILRYPNLAQISTTKCEKCRLHENQICDRDIAHKGTRFILTRMTKKEKEIKLELEAEIAHEKRYQIPGGDFIGNR